MSLRASAWAWKAQAPTPGHKLVLVALCDHANDDGECFPSIQTLAEKTGYSVRTVRAYIAELAGVGLVDKHRRHRRPDGTLGTWTYRLAIEDDQRTPASSDPLSPPTTTDQGQPYASGTPLPVAAGCRTSGTPVAQPVAPPRRAEPSVEPSENPYPPTPLTAQEPDPVTELIDRIAAVTTQNRQPANPISYRRSIARRLEREQRPALAQLIEQHPTANAEVLALSYVQRGGL